MKFQVRDGFVVHLVNRVDVGDGKIEQQEINYYGGQTCDLTKEQADQHAHKLEPKDAKATEYLEAKVAPISMPAAAPISGEALEMAKTMATEIVSAMLARLPAVQTPAPAVAATKP